VDFSRMTNKGSQEVVSGWTDYKKIGDFMNAINELRRRRGLRIIQERPFLNAVCVRFWSTSAQTSVPQCDGQLKCPHVTRVMLMVCYHRSVFCVYIQRLRNNHT